MEENPNSIHNKIDQLFQRNAEKDIDMEELSGKPAKKGGDSSSGNEMEIE